jgi:hypothetical protein
MKIVFVCVLGALISAGILGARDFEWKWSRDLPKAVATGVPPKNRTAQKVDILFGRETPPTVPQILSALGQPDGYSDQLYTRGGSLQWLLSNGGELRVDTGDFHQIYWAVRFDRRGRDTLLWK